jgi:hypothetical protein
LTSKTIDIGIEISDKEKNLKSQALQVSRTQLSLRYLMHSANSVLGFVFFNHNFVYLIFASIATGIRIEILNQMLSTGKLDLIEGTVNGFFIKARFDPAVKKFRFVDVTNDEAKKLKIMNQQH